MANVMNGYTTTPALDSDACIIFNFENNFNNTGTNKNYTYVSSSNTLGYSNIIKKSGTYSKTCNHVDYITFKLKNKTFPISISCWLYPTNTGANGVIDIGNMHIALNGSAANGDPTNGFGKAYLVCLYMKPNVNGNIDYFSTAGYKNINGRQLTGNTWNHICWVADTSSVWRLYINGTKYNIDASLYPITLGDDNHISNIGIGRRNWFDGNVDNFYLYNNYALTDAEVTALYNI
jgi:hypothetical protein